MAVTPLNNALSPHFFVLHIFFRPFHVAERSSRQTPATTKTTAAAEQKKNTRRHGARTHSIDINYEIYNTHNGTEQRKKNH